MVFYSKGIRGHLKKSLSILPFCHGYLFQKYLAFKMSCLFFLKYMFSKYVHFFLFFFFSLTQIHSASPSWNSVPCLCVLSRQSSIFSQYTISAVNNAGERALGEKLRQGCHLDTSPLSNCTTNFVLMSMCKVPHFLMPCPALCS